MQSSTRYAARDTLRFPQRRSASFSRQARSKSHSTKQLRIIKLSRRIFLIINLLIIAGLAMSGYAGILDPRKFGVLTVSGYLRPAFIVANILMTVFWIFFKFRYVIVPIAGFILCFQPVSLYCPLHPSTCAPEGSLKIMSYNTWSFSLAEENKSEIPSVERCMSMLQYIADEDCDIVCLQESSIWGLINNGIDSIIKPVYPYVIFTEDKGISTNHVFSKYPALWSETIDYETQGNRTTAHCLDVNGRHLLVINCHLETTHFSYEDKNTVSGLMKGELKGDDRKFATKYIAYRLTESSKLRAAQVDSIAAYIDRHRDMDILLCGDFNDIVNSYAHRTIGSGLTDCYRETATGPGYSYKRYGMKVRIDNAFVSSGITPYDFRIDTRCALSDHFPLIGYIEMPAR